MFDQHADNIFGTETFSYNGVVLSIDIDRLIETGLDINPDMLNEGFTIEGSDLFDAFANAFGGSGELPGAGTDVEGGAPGIPTPGGEFGHEDGPGTAPDLSGVDGSMVGFGTDEDAPWETFEYDSDYLDKRFGAGNWKENAEGDIEVGGTSTFGRDVIYHTTEGDPGTSVQTVVVQTQNGSGIFTYRELAHDAAKEVNKDAAKDEAEGKKNDAKTLKVADDLLNQDTGKDEPGKDEPGSSDTGNKMANPLDVDEGGGMTEEEIADALDSLLNGSDPLERRFEGDLDDTPPPDQTIEDFIGGMNDPITMTNIDDVPNEALGEEVLVGLEDPLINPVDEFAFG